MKERNVKLDLIRFLGVLIIMIAHSSPPGWLFQLRNFGTPLLVLGSSLTYSFIYRNKSLDHLPFLKKRLKRLTIPVWIFLSFFFLFFWFVMSISNMSFPFSFNTIIQSYILYDGIGFVWIFKIYIILALITPLCLRISKKSINNQKYFSLLVIAYLVYEGVNFLISNSISTELAKNIVNQYFLVIIPYAILYLYGLRIYHLKDRNLHIIILSAFLLFSILAIQKYITYGKFVPTQEYKYPPTVYYLSYAFFSINLCYYIVIKYVKLMNDFLRNIIIWLSSNSLWIYLWHIFAYYIWMFFIDEYFYNNFLIFCIKTVFLLTFGVIVTYIQIFIVDRLCQKGTDSKKFILLYFK